MGISYNALSCLPLVCLPPSCSVPLFPPAHYAPASLTICVSLTSPNMSSLQGLVHALPSLECSSPEMIQISLQMSPWRSIHRTFRVGFILTHITVSPARLTRLCGRLPLCLPADPPTPLLRWLVFLFLETLPSAILSLSFAYSQRPLLSFFSCKGDGQCLRHTGSPWPRGH